MIYVPHPYAMAEQGSQEHNEHVVSELGRPTRSTASNLSNVERRSFRVSKRGRYAHGHRYDNCVAKDYARVHYGNINYSITLPSSRCLARIQLERLHRVRGLSTLEEQGLRSLASQQKGCFQCHLA